jgi:hypothetical protein
MTRFGGAGVVFVDDDGNRVELAPDETDALFALTGGLDAATVSACPGCRSRVVAVVALVDVLQTGAPHTRSSELIELAEDAPTLHVYVEDVTTRCRHHDWLDPGHEEWADALDDEPSLGRLAP